MMGRMLRSGPSRALAVVLVTLSLLVARGVSSGSLVPVLDALQLSQPTSRVEAPGFELPGLDGRLVRLGDLRGRLVLLYFWATW
jgi:cytochrome oxidase Cu insertion factor (SCO1/SenC/PrrC family)